MSKGESGGRLEFPVITTNAPCYAVDQVSNAVGSPLVSPAVDRRHDSHSTCVHHLGRVFFSGWMFAFFFIFRAGRGLFFLHIGMTEELAGKKGFFYMEVWEGLDLGLFIVCVGL